MINQNAETKFITITSDSFDDLSLKMAKNNDILESKGYCYKSSNIFTEGEPIRKIHAILIYTKAIETQGENLDERS